MTLMMRKGSAKRWVGRICDLWRSSRLNSKWCRRSTAYAVVWFESGRRLPTRYAGSWGNSGSWWRGGVRQIRNALPILLEQKEHPLTQRFALLLTELSEELKQIDDRIEAHDKRIRTDSRDDKRVSRLMEIEGIGPISASALVAAVGDAKQFASGRDRAAWIGLVPGQHSSGGKDRLGHISKRGDTYLRTLLVHGARAVLNSCAGKLDRRSQWAQALAARRNRNIATVALANKNARIAWAVLSRADAYRGAQPAKQTT
jgi:transposase